jgi:hypothetical protein
LPVSPPAADQISWRALASLSRRLAGLLSRYLPIDTRPQARANLGKVEISNFCPRCKGNNFRRAKLP